MMKTVYVTNNQWVCEQFLFGHERIKRCLFFENSKRTHVDGRIFGSKIIGKIICDIFRTVISKCSFRTEFAL